MPENVLQYLAAKIWQKIWFILDFVLLWQSHHVICCFLKGQLQIGFNFFSFFCLALTKNLLSLQNITSMPAKSNIYFYRPTKPWLFCYNTFAKPKCLKKQLAPRWWSIVPLTTKMTRLSTMHLKEMEDLRENKMEPQEIKKFPMELASQDQSKLW